ncbi:MAG: putative phosphothreonine lyase domain-containing protein [Candidatus Thermoplasmatota archaeon]
MSPINENPSEVKEKGKEWLLCGLEDSPDRVNEYIEENDVSDPESMKKAHLKDYKNPKVKKIDKRAVDDAYLSGKWEVPVLPERVDDVWSKIRNLVHEDKIWGAQVTTRWIREKKDSEEHIIRVYTPNYLDEKDVMRVGNLLKDRCKIQKKISYKPDIYNILQVYSEEGDGMKLPKEIRYEI